MLITMVMWQPIKGRGEPTGACVRAHPLPPPSRSPKMCAVGRGAAVCWMRCLEVVAERKMCAAALETRAVSSQRVMRLKTRLHHCGCACTALRLASITSAPLWSQLTPSLPPPSTHPTSKTAPHFVMERVALRRPHFTAAAGVTGFLFFPACNI